MSRKINIKYASRVLNLIMQNRFVSNQLFILLWYGNLDRRLDFLQEFYVHWKLSYTLSSNHTYSPSSISMRLFISRTMIRARSFVDFGMCLLFRYRVFLSRMPDALFRFIRTTKRHNFPEGERPRNASRRAARLYFSIKPSEFSFLPRSFRERWSHRFEIAAQWETTYYFFARESGLFASLASHAASSRNRGAMTIIYGIISYEVITSVKLLRTDCRI